VQKRKVKNADKIFLHHSSSNYFEFSSSLLLDNRDIMAFRITVTIQRKPPWHHSIFDDC